MHHKLLYIVLLVFIASSCDMGGEGGGEPGPDTPILKVLDPSLISETGFQINWSITNPAGFNTIEILLSEDEVPEYKEGPCIRCGRCVDICPMGMMPFALSLCVESNKLENAAQYNPSDCIECGACTYICPARRRILESIKLIKAAAK